jgi:hypothetical protein
MMAAMKRLLPLWVLLAAPAAAWADDAPVIDGRMEGFKEGIMASPGSTVITWLLLVGIGIVTIGVMFMSAKRSHLD